MKSLGLLIAGLLLFAVAGCDRGSAAQPAEPRTHTVVIENMKFSPAVVHASSGDTVIFQNADLVPHTATERKGKSFDSGMINRNDTWKFTTTGKGTFDYRCMYHRDMAGTIIVE